MTVWCSDGAENKKGTFWVPFFLTRLRGRRSRRFHNFARPYTLRARADALGGAVNQRPHRLQVWVPPTIRFVIGMAHIMSKRGSLAADITHSCHDDFPDEMQMKNQPRNVVRHILNITLGNMIWTGVGR
jgi:hypothetical protein